MNLYRRDAHENRNRTITSWYCYSVLSNASYYKWKVAYCRWSGNNDSSYGLEYPAGTFPHIHHLDLAWGQWRFETFYAKAWLTRYFELRILWYLQWPSLKEFILGELSHSAGWQAYQNMSEINPGASPVKSLHLWNCRSDRINLYAYQKRLWWSYRPNANS